MLHRPAILDITSYKYEVSDAEVKITIFVIKIVIQVTSSVIK